MRSTGWCGGVLVSALAVASCGGGSDGSAAAPIDDTADVDSVAATGAPAQDVATTLAPDLDVATTVTTAEPAALDTPAAADASCLVGEWSVSDVELDAYYAAFGTNAAVAMGSDDAGLELDVTGDATLTLDGERFTWTPEFDVALSFGDLEGTGASTGSATGGYAVVDGRLVITVDQSDVDLSVVVGNIAMTGADLAAFIGDGIPFDGSTFDCEGPTIAFRASTDPAIRHDVLLAAR